jgi:hypothetical protein
MRRHTQNQRVIFLALAPSPLLAAYLHFTNIPLTDLQFFSILIGFPLISFGLYAVLKHQAIQTYISSHKRFFRYSAVALFLLLSLSNMTVRFRNIAPNFAYTAVLLANNFISSARTSSYLITTLNPYFVDLYSSNQYSLLPLSKNQEYSLSPARVWGFSDSANFVQTYNTLLDAGSQVFVSDFGVTSNPICKDFS